MGIRARPVRQEPAEFPVFLLARLVGPLRQGAVRRRDDRRWVAVPKARTRPVDESAFASIAASGLAEPAAAPGLPVPPLHREPAGQSQGHLDAGGAARLACGKRVVEHPVRSAAQRVREIVRRAADERGQFPRQTGETLLEACPQNLAPSCEILGAQSPEQVVGIGEHFLDRPLRIGFPRFRGARELAPDHPFRGGGPRAGEGRVEVVELEQRLELAARPGCPFVRPPVRVEQDPRHETDGDGPAPESPRARQNRPRRAARAVPGRGHQPVAHGLRQGGQALHGLVG